MTTPSLLIAQLWYFAIAVIALAVQAFLLFTPSVSWLWTVESLVSGLGIGFGVANLLIGVLRVRP